MLHFDPATGFYADDTETVRAAVAADWVAAFHKDGQVDKLYSLIDLTKVPSISPLFDSRLILFVASIFLTSMSPLAVFKLIL